MNWTQNANNRHRFDLMRDGVSIGHVRSFYDRTLGHAICAWCGPWTETAKWSRLDAATAVCRAAGVPLALTGLGIPHAWEPDPREPDICIRCLVPRNEAETADCPGSAENAVERGRP